MTRFPVILSTGAFPSLPGAECDDGENPGGAREAAAGDPDLDRPPAAQTDWSDPFVRAALGVAALLAACAIATALARL